MASFASYRRSGWVRLLVLILCALFIFCTLGAPPAQALGVESVAVFGLASVLSAATAALGFKLSSNEQGQATLQKMVQDFKTVAWATGFVLVGSKLNGLQNGMDYIKMQVQNGKTYLDARVFAWVQQWLAQNGVYNSGSLILNDYSSSDGKHISLPDIDISYYFSFFPSEAQSKFRAIVAKYNLDLSGRVVSLSYNTLNGVAGLSYSNRLWSYYDNLGAYFRVGYHAYYSQWMATYDYPSGSDAPSVIAAGSFTTSDGLHFSGADYGYSVSNNLWLNYWYEESSGIYRLSNVAGGTVVSNDTGLTGTDTLGKDVVDLTLDQVLEKLKEWAQDWYDAGADSATNAATGAKDLPLTVATGAATANPSIAEDGPLVWFPPFSIPIPNLRTGETDTNTVDQGKENASAVETSTDVAENQSVIDSLVNWALSYISPDTGLFSKFPLCVPYDAYLLVTSSLGVDAVVSDSIFGASPGDLDGVVSQDTETYSDFQPIINIKHDFELDGVIYPLDVTIDLTPWQPLVTFFREGMALLLVAELIGAEFKRIRGH